MASLPVLSGKEVVRTFGRLGWRVTRQSSSHIIMTKEVRPQHSQFQIIGKLRGALYEV